MYFIILNKEIYNIKEESYIKDKKILYLFNLYKFYM